MNLLQFLRRNPVPGDQVEIVGTPNRSELLGQTGTFVRYSFVVVQIDGEEYEVSVNNIKLVEQSAP